MWHKPYCLQACQKVVFDGRTEVEKQAQDICDDVDVKRIASGSTDEARQAIARALEVNSNCIDALRLLGDCDRKDGEFEKALESYNAALQLPPEVGPLFGQQRVHAGANVLDTDAPGTKPWVCALKGRILTLLEMNDVTNALIEAKRMLTLCPYDHDNMRYLARSLSAASGDWDEVQR
jgi:tetratricopeptide (TPR) repeat protein